eukprot:2638889-Amphidinium_carterae.1
MLWRLNWRVLLASSAILHNLVLLTCVWLWLPSGLFPLAALCSGLNVGWSGASPADWPPAAKASTQQPGQMTTLSWRARGGRADGRSTASMTMRLHPMVSTFFAAPYCGLRAPCCQSTLAALSLEGLALP